MKKILLPIDFSDNSQQAVKYAVEMFGETVYKKDVEFVLLYVEPYRSRLAPLSTKFPYAVSVSPQQLIEQRKEKLADYHAGLLEVYPDQNFKFEFIEGDIVDETVKYCEENGVSLVVMGTKGASGVAGVLMGSIAKGVVAEVPCPVLVIPEEATYRVPERILFATDFVNLENLSLLDQLKDVVKQYHPEVMTLHIYSEKKTELQDKEVMNQLLKKYFATDQYKHFFLDHKDVAEGIEEFVKGYNANMLVLVNQDRTFLGNLFHKSVTKRMLTHTAVPVFVLKAKGTSIEEEQKFRNEVQKQVEKWKGDLEELNLQISLGKAELTDEWESQKKQMRTWTERAKDGLQSGGKLAGEYGEKLKAAVESLQVQLALGKAETREVVEEQRKKIDQAILSVLHNLDGKKHKVKTTSDKIVDDMESGLLNFRNRFEHLFIQLNLGSKEAKEEWEQRRKDLRLKVHDLKHKMGKAETIAEGRWQHFKAETAEALHHLKQAFVGDKV